MDHDKAELQTVIKKAVQKRYDCDPKFYAVSGSHIYGFPSKESSDIDLRGFHIANGHDYMTLDEPKEQIIINQSENPTQGFEHVAEVELVSYELKKFGTLLYKTNFNVLEFLFHGKTVMNGDPLAIDSLRDLLREHLPSDVPYHYRGMAKQNYHKYLNREKEAYNPKAKKFLYVIRGLLAAEYVSTHAEIHPDITVLADDILDSDDQAIVDDLIEVKKTDEFEQAPEELRDRAHDLITRLFNGLEIDQEKQDRELKDDINEWMLKLRNGGRQR